MRKRMFVVLFISLALASTLYASENKKENTVGEFMENCRNKLPSAKDFKEFLILTETLSSNSDFSIADKLLSKEWLENYKSKMMSKEGKILNATTINSVVMESSYSVQVSLIYKGTEVTLGSLLEKGVISETDCTLLYGIAFLSAQCATEAKTNDLKFSYYVLLNSVNYFLQERMFSKASGSLCQ